VRLSDAIGRRARRTNGLVGPALGGLALLHAKPEARVYAGGRGSSLSHQGVHVLKGDAKTERPPKACRSNEAGRPFSESLCWGVRLNSIPRQNHPSGAGFSLRLVRRAIRRRSLRLLQIVRAGSILHTGTGLASASCGTPQQWCACGWAHARRGKSRIGRTRRPDALSLRWGIFGARMVVFGFSPGLVSRFSLPRLRSQRGFVEHAPHGTSARRRVAAREPNDVLGRVWKTAVDGVSICAFERARGNSEVRVGPAGRFLGAVPGRGRQGGAITIALALVWGRHLSGRFSARRPPRRDR